MFIVGHGSHNTATQQETIFPKILSTWDDSFHDVLINIGTDGDGVRRSVFHNLRTESLDKTSPLYNELKDLEYFDLVTLEKARTIDFDQKHISKRWRSNTISGSIKIFGKQLNSATLKRYFEAEVSALLNPPDKQNVPLAVRLLQLLIEDVAIENLPPGILDLVPALQVMRVICKGIFSFFAYPNNSLDTSLGDIAAMSHVLFDLYATRNISIPNVLYHAIQSTVQNAFFTAAKYKVMAPNENLYLYQLGSDQVEQLFCSVRTQNHDRNCDVFQLESRLTRASILDEILTKHSDWKQKPTRLGQSAIDHTNRSHWSGDLQSREISLLTCWEWGKFRAKKALPTDFKFDFDEHLIILNPKGGDVGVTDNDECQDIALEAPDLSECTDDQDENDAAFSEFEDQLATTIVIIQSTQSLFCMEGK